MPGCEILYNSPASSPCPDELLRTIDRVAIMLNTRTQDPFGITPDALVANWYASIDTEATMDAALVAAAPNQLYLSQVMYEQTITSSLAEESVSTLQNTIKGNTPDSVMNVQFSVMDLETQYEDNRNLYDIFKKNTSNLVALFFSGDYVIHWGNEANTEAYWIPLSYVDTSAPDTSGGVEVFNSVIKIEPRILSSLRAYQLQNYRMINKP